MRCLGDAGHRLLPETGGQLSDRHAAAVGDDHAAVHEASDQKKAHAGPVDIHADEEQSRAVLDDGKDHQNCLRGKQAVQQSVHQS